ncbi:hypothetical protein [Arcobacter sp.]
MLICLKVFSVIILFIFFIVLRAASKEMDRILKENSENKKEGSLFYD